MSDDEWIDEIKIELLPEGYRELIEVIGLRAAVKLSEAFGGTHTYIPKMDKILQRVRDTKIRAEFTGFNHRDLARKYHLSETWIREIVEAKIGRASCRERV